VWQKPSIISDGLEPLSNENRVPLKAEIFLLSTTKTGEFMSLLNDIEAVLHSKSLSEANLELALKRVLDHFQCSVGTIHILEEPSGLLVLRASKGVPDIVLDRVRTVPIGKGMAGLAAERRQPVQVCNLQTDRSDAAKPMARETKVEGAIAVPMLVGERLSGVLGVAKPVTYEFEQAEISLLLEIGSLIAKQLDPAVTNNP
jgi:L-methionine (R)-S-oxide reductase